MDRIITEFTFSRYIECASFTYVRFLRKDEEIEYGREQLADSKRAYLVQETDAGGKTGWRLRFGAEKIPEAWIQEQLRKKRGGSFVRKAAGAAAGLTVGMAMRSGAGLFGGGNARTGLGAARGAYNKIAGTGFDEDAFREKYKLYDHYGVSEGLYAEYEIYDVGSVGNPLHISESYDLGVKSPWCKEDVDTYRCINFCLRLDDWGKTYHGKHITLEFPTRAEAERVYYLIREHD